MIGSFFVNVRFVFQIWLQTLTEVLIVYQVNMNRVLDFVFYTEFQELTDNSGESRFYRKSKRTSVECEKITEVPLFCKYFRNVAGLFWVYPASVAESWVNMFMGCDCTSKLDHPKKTGKTFKWSRQGGCECGKH